MPTVRVTPTTTERTKNPAMNSVNGATEMNLIQEALSRARMRLPQTGRKMRSEATRSARSIAMQARRESARQMGGW
ncbi:hypothetical protein GCM10009687_01650 [Asanoa iriomotensis]|uniref:Uncharacterized protein n=1 Tax=Asanoa iriomotensis TaxID=234613 RepID=A0ABQ4CAG9_9ACTN|nr:hypothetical protein Air01nite_58770 [Asanoa iriomotensis]